MKKLLTIIAATALTVSPVSANETTKALVVEVKKSNGIIIALLGVSGIIALIVAASGSKTDKPASP